MIALVLTNTLNWEKCGQFCGMKQHFLTKKSVDPFKMFRAVSLKMSKMPQPSWPEPSETLHAAENHVGWQKLLCAQISSSSAHQGRATGAAPCCQSTQWKHLGIRAPSWLFLKLHGMLGMNTGIREPRDLGSSLEVTKSALGPWASSLTMTFSSIKWS